MKPAHLQVALAATGFSFILVFSTLLKNAGMSSLEQVLLRLVLALLLTALVFRKEVRFAPKAEWGYFLLIGGAFSLFLLCALTSLALGGSIIVTIALIYTQPVFTALFATVTGQEKLSLVKGLVIATGTLGAFLVSGLDNIISLDLSVLFGLGAGFLYALYLFLKRRRAGRPMYRMFNTFLFGLCCTVLFGAVFRQFFTQPLFVGLTMPTAYHWLVLAGFAVISTMLPYGILNHVNLKEIKATEEGLLLLLDPVLGQVWAILIFAQSLSPLRFLGAALVLLSAGLSAWRRRGAILVSYRLSK